MEVSGKVSFVDMGNGFTLFKFTNEVDCNRIFYGQPWLVGGQVFSLQRRKKDFDLVKEQLLPALLCVRNTRLPLEVYTKSALEKILKLICKI